MLADQLKRLVKIPTVLIDISDQLPVNLIAMFSDQVLEISLVLCSPVLRTFLVCFEMHMISYLY
jgi:hypothetical protein